MTFTSPRRIASQDTSCASRPPRHINQPNVKSSIPRGCPFRLTRFPTCCYRASPLVIPKRTGPKATTCLNEVQLTAHGIHARSTTTPHQLAPNDTTVKFKLPTADTTHMQWPSTHHRPRSHIGLPPSPERVAAAAARPRANIPQPSRRAGREGNNLATRPEGIRRGANSFHLPFHPPSRPPLATSTTVYILPCPPWHPAY